MTDPDREGSAGRPQDRLRILLVSPPMQSVPPRRYGGTERVVAVLAEGLHARGHDVTLIAPGDSEVSCRLVRSVPRSLWAEDPPVNAVPYLALTAAMAWEMAPSFDIVHSHLEGHGFLMARYCGAPVVSTLHGRLDGPDIAPLIDAFPDVPLVAISASQRRWHPDANWMGTVHHGLLAPDGEAAHPTTADLVPDPKSGHLAFVGRATREKGVGDAIALARRAGMPLHVAAKVREDEERELFEAVVRPAIDEGVVEFHGELDTAARDDLFAGAYATVMLVAWPEPFGLVTIESLAAGTPVIARRAGALPEIVEHGVDGFLVDDIAEAELALRRIPTLDRARIRRRARERFSTERMLDDYEAIYRRVIAEAATAATAACATAPPAAPASRGASRGECQPSADPERSAAAAV